MAMRLTPGTPDLEVWSSSLVFFFFFRQGTLPHLVSLYPGSGCSKLDEDNPGLVRNLNSDSKA